MKNDFFNKILIKPIEKNSTEKVQFTSARLFERSNMVPVLSRCYPDGLFFIIILQKRVCPKHYRYLESQKQKPLQEEWANILGD